MQYQSIKISELEQFLQSDLYQNSKNIPITQQRALSQIQNPRANDSDIALIIAYTDNNQIVGFIGALPEKLPKHSDIKLAWNSCWWIDPKTGKETAIPLFLRFLKAYNYQVMFRDLTDKTEQILMRFKQFKKVKNLQGFRYFIRLNSAEILPKKNKNFKLITPILKGIDFTVNRILSIKNNPFLKRNSLRAEQLKNIDNEAELFIKKHQQNELFKRSKTELNWILNNPWVVKESLKNKEQYYYFSDTAKKFKNTVFKLYNKDNQLIAVVFFTNNNGLIKIPYIYFEVSFLTEIIQFIFAFILSENATSLLVFNPILNKVIQKNKNPFWYKKELQKDFIVGKKLTNLLPDNFVFQDGEGDFVFT